MTATKTSTRKSRKGSSKPDAPTPAPTQGFRVIRWIERHCVHTKAKWIGRPFKLLPWQKRLILELFEVDPATGLRRYRWALIGVPKKNGKTELAAALALYFLIGDGEAQPDIPCAAASEDQADLVFGAAKTMVEMSPTLSQVCEVYDKEILVPSKPGAKLYRVAAVGGAGDGGNVFVAVLDELHEWTKAKHETTWTVLTGGGGARDAPLVLQITTAGWDLDTICGREYEYGKKVESGEIDDPAYFFRWWEAPADADHTDPKVWADCNPSFGVTVQAPYLATQLRKKPANTFRRYYTNNWTTTEDSWLEPGDWPALEDRDFRIDNGVDVVLFVDLGLKKDTAAIDVLTELGDGRIGVEAMIFDPAEVTVSYGMIEQAIRDAGLRWNVLAVGFDPWRFGRSAELLSDEGFVLADFPMTNERTTKATDRLYAAIVDEQRLVHNGDPKFRAHVEAGSLKDTDRGQRLDKGKARRPIDALIALMGGLPIIDELEGFGFGFDAGDDEE